MKGKMRLGACARALNFNLEDRNNSGVFLHVNLWSNCCINLPWSPTCQLLSGLLLVPAVLRQD